MRPLPRLSRLVALGLAGGLVAACQLIVSDELPAFRCSGDAPNVCPTGLVCGPYGVCITPGETTEDGGDAAPGDASTGVDAGGAIGAECVLDGDCATGLLCGSSSILGTTIVPQDSKSICTRPCCTSEQCPAGDVCYASATGSAYCVPGTRAGVRSSTKNLPGGSACTQASDCRSGACTGRCADDTNTPCTKASDCEGSVECTQLECLDTCCHEADCASGSVCRTFAGTSHAAWACGAPNVLPDGGASRDVGATCTQLYECKTGSCTVDNFPSKHCVGSCCSSADCAVFGTNYACGYGQSGTDLLKWCFAPTAGTLPNGSTCTTDAKCASHYCDPEQAKCLDVCCTDADCAKGDAGTAKRCLPSPVGTPMLRCVDP